jgi:hypothetical protein
MANKLFVGGLPYETTQAELAKLFSACGKVSDVKLIMDRDTGRSKGFGFVEMGSDEEARAAVQKLNGTLLGARKIFINEARPQEKRAEAAAAPGLAPGFVERRSGKDRRRQPLAAPAAERRWEPKPGGFPAEKKWERKPGGFGGPKSWDKKPGGFGGEKKWDKKPGGFGGEKKWDKKPGGFGGEKKWDKKPGGFAGPKKWDKKPGGFGGGKKFGKPGGFGGGKKFNGPRGGQRG